jgi:hypothetical protein
MENTKFIKVFNLLNIVFNTNVHFYILTLCELLQQYIVIQVHLYYIMISA